KVTDVVVQTSAGDDFDQAAIAAARELAFEPAQRDGTPVASKIPFRFQFEAPAPATEATTPVAVPAPAPAAPAASPAVPSDSLDIEVEGQRPAREPTQRTMAAEEIRKIPGT